MLVELSDMSLEKPGENELLQALALDVAGAFPRLLASYHSQLLRFVMSEVHDPDVAEDILQDCWVRVYQALQAYSVERIQTLRLEAWLFKITRNQMYTYLQKKNRMTILSTEDLEDTIIESSALLPDEILLIKNQAEMVVEAVQQLPSVSRSVLTLYLFQEFSYQQIAAQLGLTVGNVRTHVSRGLKELRKKLTTSVN
jgi:RNA polymerase sigma-70 factor, ECF subfamily